MNLSTIQKTVLYLFGGALLFLAIYFYSILTENQFEKLLSRNQPVGVQLAMIDTENENRLEVSIQLVIIPEHRMIALYFLNTSSYDENENPIWEKNPKSPNSISNYSGVENQYYLTISKQDAIRIINLGEGMISYNAEKYDFEKGKFNYYTGKQYWSGQQILEFMLSKRIFKKKTELNRYDIDRLYRQETVILNLFWNLPNYIEKIHDKLTNFSYSLIQTNMNIEEISSFMHYTANLKENFIKILEVPLGFSTLDNEKVLQIKSDQAKLFFREFLEDVELGKHISPDIISFEVLNGTNTNWIAHRLKNFLQGKNINVLGTGNYEFKPVKQSFFLNHSGYTFSASYGMDILKISREQIFFRRAYNEIADKIIIGEDMNPKTFRLKKIEDPL